MAPSGFATGITWRLVFSFMRLCSLVGGFRVSFMYSSMASVDVGSFPCCRQTIKTGLPSLPNVVMRILFPCLDKPISSTSAPFPCSFKHSLTVSW